MCKSLHNHIKIIFCGFFECLKCTTSLTRKLGFQPDEFLRVTPRIQFCQMVKLSNPCGPIARSRELCRVNHGPTLTSLGRFFFESFSSIAILPTMPNAIILYTQHQQTYKRTIKKWPNSLPRMHARPQYISCSVILCMVRRKQVNLAILYRKP